MRELAMLRLLWEPTCHGNGRKHQQTATDTGDQPLPVVQRRTHTDDPHTHAHTNTPFAMPQDKLSGENDSE